nr:zinc finger, CCHC-type [Tanacetum cinerariifolium]
MSTQQDIYAAGSENRPPMLNKENYVPWSSRLLQYAKSRPNGKFIHNSIINGPYVRRMIPEPGDTNREAPVNETFHIQTNDELTEKELKQIEADDQAIQTILLGLPEDIYASEKKAKLFNEWERFTLNDGESIESYYHRFLKLMNDLKQNKHFPEKITSNLKFLNNLQPEWSRHKDVDELKAERLAKTQDPLVLMANSNNPYNFPVLKQDQPSFNQNYMQQPMPNPKDIRYLTTVMNIALTLMAKAFKLNYSTPTNNNQRISSNPCNRQITQPGMNMGQDRQMQMVGGNGENQFRQYAGQNVRNLNGGVGHFARNCTVRPRRRDAAYLQTQLLISQKEEARIQLQAEEFDLMAAAADLNKIEEINANCILMANLQQASTSGTQTDGALVYDFDGSAEYTELLEPIPESHQVPQNDNNVISEVTSVEQSGETVEQHPANGDETRALYDSLYHNLAIEVEKVNTEQCLSKKINALHLSSDKPIMTLNEEISDLNKQLSKEKSTVSFLLEEKKKLKSDFKIHEDELLDKQIQLEKRIKELDNILIKTGVKVISLSRLLVSSNETISEIYNFIHLLNKLWQKKMHFLLFSMSVVYVLTTHIPDDGDDATVDQLRKRAKWDKDDYLCKEVDNTKTRRPQPRSNTKNDRVPSASKSSCNKNKGIEVVEHHWNLLLSKNKKHMSSVCNNAKLYSHNVISKFVCAMCKQCLIFANHDVCLLNYVNGKTSRGKKQKANVLINDKQKKQQPEVKKTKKVGFIERLATSKSSKPRSFLRWSPTGRLFDLKGKIITFRKSESQSDYSKGDNACTSNPLEPTIKWFPKSTFSLACNPTLFMVRRLGLFQAHGRKSKASHQFRLEVFGNCSLRK